MRSSSKLADLPLLPRDENGPVFAEPWQAQAFAVVVELIDAGKRYYEHWLTALERLAVETKLTGWEDLAKERERIQADDHHRREEQLGSTDDES